MPELVELTVEVKIFLAVVAASAGVLAGVLGNELSKNVVYFFRGSQPGRPPAKKPVRVWVLFFVAALVFILGSVLVAFSPTRRPSPDVTVFDNSREFQFINPSGFVGCRHRIEFANISDVPTSVIAVGTQLFIGDLSVSFEASDEPLFWTNDDYSMFVSPWKAGPPIEGFVKAKSMNDFLLLVGTELPVLVDQHGTAELVVDVVIEYKEYLQDNVIAVHLLKFTDIEPVSTESIFCIDIFE